MATAKDFIVFAGSVPPPAAAGAVCPRCGIPTILSAWLVMRASCEACGAHEELTCPHCFAGSDGVHDKWPPIVFVGDETQFPGISD